MATCAVVGQGAGTAAAYAVERDRLPSTLAGDPAAIREQFDEFAELGYSMSMLSFPRFPETDELRLFMDEVVPHFS